MAAVEAGRATMEARALVAPREPVKVAATAPAVQEDRAVVSQADEGAAEAFEPVEARANGEAAAPSMENPDETNVWPTASEEAAFLSEARGRGEVVVPVARETAEEVEENAKALPKLSELVERIPPETRELLDELFRARFVAVKRVPKKALKGEAAR